MSIDHACKYTGSLCKSFVRREWKILGPVCWARFVVLHVNLPIGGFDHKPRSLRPLHIGCLQNLHKLHVIRHNPKHRSVSAVRRSGLLSMNCFIHSSEQDRSGVWVQCVAISSIQWNYMTHELASVNPSLCLFWMNFADTNDF